MSQAFQSHSRKFSELISSIRVEQKIILRLSITNVYVTYYQPQKNPLKDLLSERKLALNVFHFSIYFHSKDSVDALCLEDVPYY